MLVRRSLLPIAVFAAALAIPLPASAQYGFDPWGGSQFEALDIQKLRDEQRARLQKYAAPVSPNAGVSGAHRGAAGPYGRVDMSGRPVAGYATIRDDKAVFGPPRWSASRTAAPTAPASPRKAPAHRTGTSALLPKTPPPPPPVLPPAPPPTTSRVRIPPPPPLPSPPIP